MKPLIPLPALLLLAMPLHADYNMNGKIIDCYCTDSVGGRVDIGETICLNVDGKMFMAECQMALNVPIWRKVADGCLSSDLRQPRLDPLAVDPEIAAPKS